MPFNVQPDLDGDTVILVGTGAANTDSKVTYFAFDISSGTISNLNGDGNATTTTGDTVTASAAASSTATQTTEGLGSSFLGDSNEGPL